MRRGDDQKGRGGFDGDKGKANKSRKGSEVNDGSQGRRIGRRQARFDPSKLIEKLKSQKYSKEAQQKNEGKRGFRGDDKKEQSKDIRKGFENQQGYPKKDGKHGFRGDLSKLSRKQRREMYTQAPGKPMKNDGKRGSRGDKAKELPKHKSKGLKQNQASQQKKDVKSGLHSNDKRNQPNQVEKKPKVDMGKKSGPRPITIAEIKKHDGRRGDGSFWSVIDGWVVDATQFLERHPGGKNNILMSGKANVSATGQPYGFSFSRGPAAHNPETNKVFREAVTQYLARNNHCEGYIPRMYVNLQHYGKIVILGRLSYDA